MNLTVRHARQGLIEILQRIEKHDEWYEEREIDVYEALWLARLAEFPAGFRIDPQEPEWPVAFILLPTGQVSWHMPQFGQSWDGHSTEEKYGRCRAYEVWFKGPHPLGEVPRD